MKEKVEYKFGEFTDFNGVTRKFIVAAVSRPVNTMYVAEYGKDNHSAPEINKVLSIGIAICNPVDTYDEETGKRIAYNKAVATNNSLKLYASFSGMINTKMVDALIDQEIAYFKNYPESHIKGYNEAYYKYMQAQKQAAEIIALKDKLSAAEFETVNYIKNLDSSTRDAMLKLIGE